MTINMMIRSYIFLILMVIFSSSFVVLVPETAEGLGEPFVMLEFDEGEAQQMAEVAPGKDAVVIFPGTVTAHMAAGSQVQNIVVNLYGSVEQGWPVTMDPVTIEMDHGGNESFTATVVVPADACCDRPAILQFRASAKSNPGAAVYYNIEPINGTILITQYYGFSLETKKSLKDAYIEDDVEFDLNVINDGNGRDMFSVRLVNQKEIENLGMTLSLNMDKFEIDGKSSETITLLITIPENNDCIGTHSMEVEVRSENENADSTNLAPRSISFILKVSQSPEPEENDPVKPETPDELDRPDDQEDDAEAMTLKNNDIGRSGESSFETGIVIITIVAAVAIILICLLFTRKRYYEKYY